MNRISKLAHLDIIHKVSATYFLLSLQLSFQVENERRFEILDALQFESFQFAFDGFGDSVELLLTAIHLSLPLSDCQYQIKYLRILNSKARSRVRERQIYLLPGLRP